MHSFYISDQQVEEGVEEPSIYDDLFSSEVPKQQPAGNIPTHQ